MSLLNIKPQFVICDMHPGYFSTEFAKSMDLPVFEVQHHFAHAASVLAEHGIYDNAIAVCFDGTGYGNDGAAWGGEFIVYREKKFERVGYLNYVDLLGADSAAKDAKKTALCYLINAGIENPQCFDNHAEIVKVALRMGAGTFKTSSAGRLFDAFSAILGICNRNDYEGQCAAALQQAAELAVKNGIPPVDLNFNIAVEDTMFVLGFSETLKSVYNKKHSVQAVALGFHLALSAAVVNICKQISEKTDISIVALSGGVFQNRLLTELIVKGLRESGMKPFINCASSPNDGGISLGQAYLGGLLCV